MTLCDPFAINFLSQSAMKLVNFQVNWNLRREGGAEYKYYSTPLNWQLYILLM